MIVLPEIIVWAGKGSAVRLSPKGMSDYQRGNGNAIYETAEGYRLIMVQGKWRAQHKGTTTKWCNSAEDAISNYNAMIGE